MKPLRRSVAALACGALALGITGAQAQTYLDKPISTG